MSTKKALVAMSGGVDSAVAALLLMKSGYDIGGITMKLWSENASVHDEQNTSADENILEAQKIAFSLGIPHYSVAFGDSFRENVVNRFISEYINGRTPNPCVDCNKHLKFGKLFDEAKRLGYPLLATGHYARIEKDTNGKLHLKKAKDQNKDQSYFLWSVNKQNLSKILFPLGNFTKSEIREIASENNFTNAHRSDSQDICFIPNGDYISFINKHSNAVFPKGNFIDINGNILGTHEGIIRYTVGQRKGLGIALGVPVFVGQKNISDNTVTLCADSQLYKKELTASSVNLIDCDSIESPSKFSVKIRYRHTPASATVQMTDKDKIKVIFDEPQRAIAPGQSAVLYDGDTVIGGGVID